jgi:hypothetical protein
MPDKNWALINGSMVNSLDKYQPIRLQGKPKLLTKDGKYSTLHKNKHYDQIERFAVRCFSMKKPEVLSHLLGNLSSSRNYKGEPTLTTTHMVRYLHADRRHPVVVFWNGKLTKNYLIK